MNSLEKEIFQRSSLLLGEEQMDLLAQKKVIILGIGGVGSWCAESLIRTGITHLTLVDFDKVCVSNVNRQLHATFKTIGKSKVEVLKNRLIEINPNANINAIQNVFSAENANEFELEKYDFVVDAIDSIESKIHLIRAATKTNATLFSSMGAALRIDPLKVKVAEFWNVKGCPLGYIIRKKIRKGELPAKPFMCVYSEEVLENKGEILEENMDENEYGIRKAVTNGSLVHITAIFGFTIAGLIIQSVYEENEK